MRWTQLIDPLNNLTLSALVAAVPVFFIFWALIKKMKGYQASLITVLLAIGLAIRLSILWEWVHKGATLREADPETGVKAGDSFDSALFKRLLEEEYNKLLKACSKDVHDGSKTTTLPISREIALEYVLDEMKAPWFIDLLNINLNNTALDVAKKRIRLFMDRFKKEGIRITENLDY